MPGWIDIIIRSFIFMIILFITTKMLGKKQISELSFLEYVSGITIGSIAGEAITGLEDSMVNGAIGIFFFGGLTFLVDALSLKSKSFRDIVEGRGAVIIKDGKILEENLKKEKYTIDELSALLRQKNIFRTADVEFAVLEPRGNLSVLLKKDNQPLTPKDLHLKTANEKEPQTVIMDGSILDEALRASGKNRGWLETELEKMNLSLPNVFMGQINSYGELTVDIYDDKIKVPSPQQRPLLLATLKKCQADMMSFSLQTQSQEAKTMFQKNGEKLEETIKKLSPYLKG